MLGIWEILNPRDRQYEKTRNVIAALFLIGGVAFADRIRDLPLGDKIPKI